MNNQWWKCVVIALGIAVSACDGESGASGGESGTTTSATGGGGVQGVGGEGVGATGGDGGSADGGSGGAGPVDKAGDCVKAEDELGTSLTSAFGRLDGTVLAVVKPSDTACYLPNNDHVVLQVLWNGEAYRMVINIESSFGDPEVFFFVHSGAVDGLVWEEGWHTGVAFDYVEDLGVHTDAPFEQLAMLELADAIADEITLGQKVSVFATSDGFPSSAHLIHRNGGGEDGAIVLDPDSENPRVLLFHFDNQTF